MLQSSFQAPISGALPPSPHSGDPQRCRIGRPGCCQHHLCHLSCSAAGCSACDKTWVYSGAEKYWTQSGFRPITEPLRLLTNRSPCSSLSLSQGQSRTSLFVNLFLARPLRNSCSVSANLFRFAGVQK